MGQGVMSINAAFARIRASSGAYHAGPSLSLRELPLLKLNAAPKKGLIPHFPVGRSIPRILHQTHSHRNLPPEIIRSMAELRLLNPGWTHNFYDDGDRIAFIRNEYGLEVLNYYLRIEKVYGAARADLFRYLALYRLGGVYLDVKSAASRSFDDVLRPDDSFLLSQWPRGDGSMFVGWGDHAELKHIPGGEFQQWFIAAVPGHPFLKAVIENVLGNIDRYIPGIHRTGAHAVFRVTGPIAYTLAIAPLLELAPHRMVDSEVDLGLSYSIYSHIAPQAHKLIFSAHYAELTTSLIKVPAWKKVVFAIYRAIAKPYKAMLRYARGRRELSG